MLLLSERAGAAGRQDRGPDHDRHRRVICAGRSGSCCPTIGRHPSFLTTVLPGIVLFGLGLCTLVAPLTGTVLAAAPDRYAGHGERDQQRRVSRAGGLLAIAALPLLVGLTGDDYATRPRSRPAYRHAMCLCAGLLLAGAGRVLAGITRGAGRPAADVS